jgi:hypothetical protein
MRLRGHARLWMHRNGGAALGRDPRSRTLRCQGTVTRGNAAIRDVLRRQGRAKPGSARQKQSRARQRLAKAKQSPTAPSKSLVERRTAPPRNSMA